MNERLRERERARESERERERARVPRKKEKERRERDRERERERERLQVRRTRHNLSLSPVTLRINHQSDRSCSRYMLDVDSAEFWCDWRAVLCTVVLCYLLVVLCTRCIEGWYERGERWGSGHVKGEEVGGALF